MSLEGFEETPTGQHENVPTAIPNVWEAQLPSEKARASEAASRRELALDPPTDRRTQIESEPHTLPRAAIALVPPADQRAPITTEAPPGLRAALSFEPAALESPAEHRSLVSVEPSARTAAPVGDRQAPASLDSYLNGLLGARAVSEREDDAPMAGERWGGRLRHPFVILWALLAVGGSGVGGWLWFDARQRAAEVETRLASAHASMRAGSPEDLASAVENATMAVERDPGSLDALAALAAARTLALHLHGQGQITEAGATVVAARQSMKTAEASPQAHRDLAVAEAALALGAADRGLDARSDLTSTRVILDREVDRFADDPLLTWLDGQVAAATGDRARARTILARAADSLPAAALALAELDLDDGDLASASARLERIPGLPMARAEDRLARALVGLQAEPESAPPAAPSILASTRAAGWLHLADFYDARAHGDSPRALDALRAAGGASTEARFLAWLALAEIDAGRPGDAGAARARLRTAGTTPIAAVVDGELVHTDGKAAETIPIGVHPRTHRNHGRALLADGKPADAAAELDTVSDPETHAWAELAHYLATSAPRARPPSALVTVAAGAKGTADAWYFAGEAWLAGGENGRALEAFTTCVAKGGGTNGYRAQTRLAEMALAAGKPADAESNARAAIAVAPTFPAAHAALGRALLAKGDAAGAGSELQMSIDAARGTAEDEMAYAEAAIVLGHPDLAKDAVKRAKAKNAPVEALTVLAQKIDPQFAVELGLGPAAKPAAPPPAPKGRDKHKGSRL